MSYEKCEHCDQMRNSFWHVCYPCRIREELIREFAKIMLQKDMKVSEIPIVARHLGEQVAIEIFNPLIRKPIPIGGGTQFDARKDPND